MSPGKQESPSYKYETRGGDLSQGHVNLNPTPSKEESESELVIKHDIKVVEEEIFNEADMNNDSSPKFRLTTVITAASPGFTTRTSSFTPATDAEGESRDLSLFSTSTLTPTPRSLENNLKTLMNGSIMKTIPARLLDASKTRIELQKNIPPVTNRPRPIHLPFKTKNTRNNKRKKAPATKKPIRRFPTKNVKPNSRSKKTTTAKMGVQYYQRDPNHPHGQLVFNLKVDDLKRKKTKGRSTTTPTPKPRRRNKPKRPQNPKRKTTTVTTTTTTTTPPTTTTTTPEPVIDDDDYDNDNEDVLSSGEDEIGYRNESTFQRIPLSKLALAMLASSSEFDNGTDDLIYYPKTPVNLLNILQAYTKQMEVAQTETFKPPVRIQNQPFITQLNPLNFAAKVGISIYYSIIALIPLVYLAFGGLGKLGLGAMLGRNLEIFGGRRKSGRRKRRRKRSFNFHDSGNYLHVNALKRIRLTDADRHGSQDDEYNWILERISDVIWELSRNQSQNQFSQEIFQRQRLSQGNGNFKFI